MSSPTNPYIAGNPITGTEMFFGRQDVFRFVRETLVGRYQDNAIVLYGGRRTGKTTVLYQMGRYLDPRYIPVFVDLQAISLEGLGEMLWGIARQATRALRRQKGIVLSIPSRDEFAIDPGGCFREGFLDPALEALGDDHLLVMLDEAARLYEQVQAGRLERRVFDLLRNLIQYHPRLNFIFSIGSGLEEMGQEYAVLFNVCRYRKISFLDRGAAEALITEPVEEHYRYAPGVVERILETTHGQPYYTQLVCNRLFARWARQDGDEVTVSDVEVVLGEVVEQGMASLQYTWEEASDAAKVVLAALAEIMGDANRPVSTNDLRATVAAQEIALSRRAVSGALQELVTREVLCPTDGGYVFTVDLMRLWVQQYQRLEWVKSKILPPEEVRPPARRDWVRMILVGVLAVSLFLLIGLSVVLWREMHQGSAKQPPLEISGTATLTLYNVSAQPVCYVYISSTGDDRGDNRLGAGEVVSPTKSQEFVVQRGAYHLWAGDCNHQEIDARRDFAISGVADWIIGSSLAKLTLHNNFEQLVCYVYISPTSSDKWGSNCLEPGEEVAPGQSREFAVRQMVYDLKAENCDHQVISIRWSCSIGGVVEWTIGTVD